MRVGLRRDSLKAFALATAALAALSVPSGAIAQCKDSTGLSIAAGLPLQTLYPLGVGNSLNSLLSTINTVNTAFLTNTASFVSAPNGASANQQTGGVWGRTVAGYVDTKATSTSEFSLAPATTGTGTCVGTVHEEYVGSQFGFDLGKVNLDSNGANFHFGITGGYFNSKSKDQAAQIRTDDFTILYTLPNGTLSVDSQVPFVGLYAVLTQGGFFADTQLRFDFYKNSLTDASNALAAQTLDARGVSVTGNLGYNIKLPSDWFIEPSVGVVWSHVSVDDFTSAGVYAPRKLNLLPPLLLGVGTVQFDDIESLLGRASLRVGTTVTNGNYIWQPFATASVLREFAGKVGAKSEITGGDFAGTLNLTNDRVGTYGQFGLGTGVVFGNSGWLGYGRVDYKTGENIEGVNVNVGLRHQW
jgi:hypothetical protein